MLNGPHDKNCSHSFDLDEHLISIMNLTTKSMKIGVNKLWWKCNSVTKTCNSITKPCNSVIKIIIDNIRSLLSLVDIQWPGEHTHAVRVFRSVRRTKKEMGRSSSHIRGKREWGREKGRERETDRQTKMIKRVLKF